MSAKFAWLDLRGLSDAEAIDAIIQEALHHGVAGIVAEPAVLEQLPPTVTRVAIVPPGLGAEERSRLAAVADAVLVDVDRDPAAGSGDVAVSDGVAVTVSDSASLTAACEYARRCSFTLIHFTDPTKIPLEIVLAAADASPGQVLTVVGDLEEAEITLGVLERGSDGLVLAPRQVGDAAALAQLCRSTTPALALVELEVTGISHVGLGDRVCVDTCSRLGEDEGLLVGSFATGMILEVSETHPLPYMPTRPFRVNAGALHSYVVAPDDRTRYLSELGAGVEVLAVRTDGRTRRVVVGRAKLETRPLLQIDAVSPDGVAVSLTVQDDWHVRVLGPGSVVLNVTELKAGSKVLGYTPTAARHVGWRVTEFLEER